MMVVLRFYLVLIPACIIVCVGGTNQPSNTPDKPACPVPIACPDNPACPASQPSQQCPSCPASQPSQQCPACPASQPSQQCPACPASQPSQQCPACPAGPQYIYGGVVIAGGYDSGGARLSSTEGIATHQRPALPVKVEALSLTRVGDTLYACGGVITGTGSGNRCYTLVPEAAVWSDTVRLPVAMDSHTAVTVGYHIWFVFESHLYSLNTNANTFLTYTLPFNATQHCAVSTSTHVYIVGAGSTWDQVWVNKEASSPAQWQRVATLPRHGRALACLWPAGGSSIVVTGGGGVGRVYTSLLNTATNTVTEAADMLQARTYHQMLMLDGKPAVVGGRYVDSGRQWQWLNTIETYDTASNKWQRHPLTLHTARSSFGLTHL